MISKVFICVCMAVIKGTMKVSDQPRKWISSRLPALFVPIQIQSKYTVLVDDIGTECVEYDCKRFGILAQDKKFDGSFESYLLG